MANWGGMLLTAETVGFQMPVTSSSAETVGFGMPLTSSSAEKSRFEMPLTAQIAGFLVATWF